MSNFPEPPLSSFMSGYFQAQNMRRQDTYNAAQQAIQNQHLLLAQQQQAANIANIQADNLRQQQQAEWQKTYQQQQLEEHRTQQQYYQDYHNKLIDEQQRAREDKNRRADALTGMKQSLSKGKYLQYLIDKGFTDKNDINQYMDLYDSVLKGQKAAGMPVPEDDTAPPAAPPYTNVLDAMRATSQGVTPGTAGAPPAGAPGVVPSAPAMPYAPPGGAPAAGAGPAAAAGPSVLSPMAGLLSMGVGAAPGGQTGASVPAMPQGNSLLSQPPAVQQIVTGAGPSGGASGVPGGVPHPVVGPDGKLPMSPVISRKMDLQAATIRSRNAYADKTLAEVPYVAELARARIDDLKDSSKLKLKQMGWLDWKLSDAMKMQPVTLAKAYADLGVKTAEQAKVWQEISASKTSQAHLVQLMNITDQYGSIQNYAKRFGADAYGEFQKSSHDAGIASKNYLEAYGNYGKSVATVDALGALIDEAHRLGQDKITYNGSSVPMVQAQAMHKTFKDNVEAMQAPLEVLHQEYMNLRDISQNWQDALKANGQKVIPPAPPSSRYNTQVPPGARPGGLLGFDNGQTPTGPADTPMGNNVFGDTGAVYGGGYGGGGQTGASVPPAGGRGPGPPNLGPPGGGGGSVPPARPPAGPPPKRPPAVDPRTRQSQHNIFNRFRG